MTESDTAQFRTTARKLLYPTAGAVGLVGVYLLGVTIGMLLAQRMLTAADLVEPTPAAEVLALPGFGICLLGLAMVGGAKLYMRRQGK